MEMLGGNRGQAVAQGGQPSQAEPIPAVSEPDFSQPEEDDLPF
jgi:hypothetical protein